MYNPRSHGHGYVFFLVLGFGNRAGERHECFTAVRNKDTGIQSQSMTSEQPGECKRRSSFVSIDWCLNTGTVLPITRSLEASFSHLESRTWFAFTSWTTLPFKAPTLFQRRRDIDAAEYFSARIDRRPRKPLNTLHL